MLPLFECGWICHDQHIHDTHSKLDRLKQFRSTIESIRGDYSHLLPEINNVLVVVV